MVTTPQAADAITMRTLFDLRQVSNNSACYLIYCVRAFAGGVPQDGLTLYFDDTTPLQAWQALNPTANGGRAYFVRAGTPTRYTGIMATASTGAGGTGLTTPAIGPFDLGVPNLPCQNYYGAAPQITAKGRDQYSIDVNWTTAQTVDMDIVLLGYQLDRGDSATGPWTNIAGYSGWPAAQTLGPNSTHYLAGAPTTGGHYWFRLTPATSLPGYAGFNPANVIADAIAAAPSPANTPTGYIYVG